MRNIFLRKLYTSCGGEASSRSLLYVQVEAYQIILKLRCLPLAFTWHKVFLKSKKRSGISLPASCFAWFLKKNISHIMFYWLTKFHYQIPFTSWDTGQMSIALICFPVCGIKKFETNLRFPIKLFFSITKTSEQKCKYFKDKKSF